MADPGHSWCDNARPFCRKCIDTGRECAGYERETVFIIGTIQDQSRCSSHPPRVVKCKKSKLASPEAENAFGLDPMEPLRPACQGEEDFDLRSECFVHLAGSARPDGQLLFVSLGTQPDSVLQCVTMGIPLRPFGGKQQSSNTWDRSISVRFQTTTSSSGSTGSMRSSPPSPIEHRPSCPPQSGSPPPSNSIPNPPWTASLTLSP
ncbi:hypothetical protein VTK26DRAFT_7041 [Humicola hyalothermophila]